MLTGAGISAESGIWTGVAGFLLATRVGAQQCSVSQVGLGRPLKGDPYPTYSSLQGDLLERVSIPKGPLILTPSVWGTMASWNVVFPKP